MAKLNKGKGDQDQDQGKGKGRSKEDILGKQRKPILDSCCIMLLILEVLHKLPLRPSVHVREDVRGSVRRQADDRRERYNLSLTYLL